VSSGWEKSDFTGLVEAVQCSCTSMAQCMRHTSLDVFASSCLDMHGEYILTEGTDNMSWPCSAACVALFPVGNATGSWQLFKIASRSRVRRTHMVKLVTSKLVVDAMNAIAKEKAEAMSPNQVDLEVGSDQQSTENEVEESEVAPNEDPAEIYPELQPETQVEIPPEILEENEEERQEPVEKQVQKKGEEQRTVTTRLGREIRQPTRYLAVTNLSKQDWKKTEADRAIKAELTTLFKVGSYDMYLRCWRALAP
jgi:hypothetical protein